MKEAGKEARLSHPDTVCVFIFGGGENWHHCLDERSLCSLTPRTTSGLRWCGGTGREGVGDRKGGTLACWGW